MADAAKASDPKAAKTDASATAASAPAPERQYDPAKGAGVFKVGDKWVNAHGEPTDPPAGES